mmetsp:Transcript_33554/g.78011  ORF Transcript_33554/g.78011 Transcript_33554/m.78011 type:complete len:297 (+) Transcript_33554:89-979(+)
MPLLRALFASLVCARLFVGGQSLDGAVALLQSAVHINDEVEAPPTSKRYLVDNSVLGHKGPGLLWRSTKDMNSTVAADQYVAWGTTVEGFDAGSGWVKVNNLYLPTHIRGAAVLKQNEVEAGERKKLRISYRPTSVHAQDGSWIPCQIVGLGSRPDTFDLNVMPRDFANYEMKDVPASMLKKVQRVRQFVSMPAATPTVKEVKKAKREPVTPAPEDMEGFMQVRVGDLDGKMLELQVLKKSPLRTTMKMACAHAQTPWLQCLSKIRFVHKGVQLNETQHPYQLGWRDTETIHMQRV